MFFVLCLEYPLFPVTLDSTFLIASSVMIITFCIAKRIKQVSIIHISCVFNDDSDIHAITIKLQLNLFT